MTFQAYNRTRRLGAALDRMRGGADLTRVGLEHGFDSASGFRDAFARTFGGPPGRRRTAPCVVAHTIESPLGPLLICATPTAVSRLDFGDPQPLDTRLPALQQRLGCPVVPGTNERIEQLTDELARYFAGELQEFRVPLVYGGTPFQHAVWSELRRIPYGQTISYEELARRVGRPGAQRAVGQANGANPIGIVIPCHRVVNKGGQLGGYGGGLWRKQLLLDLERRGAGRDAVPGDLFGQTHRRGASPRGHASAG